MDLAYHARSVASSQRTRARIRRSGYTSWGHKLWSDAEDGVVRRHYPDYKAILRALPHRTYDACKNRALSLGVTTKRHQWSARDISILRKIFPKYPREQIVACFEGVSWSQIKAIANYNEIYRSKAPYKRTGTAVLDQIRDRCRELNYSMTDLDRLCRSRHYFAKQGWLNGYVNDKFIARAARALFGELTVEWK